MPALGVCSRRILASVEVAEASVLRVLPYDLEADGLAAMTTLKPAELGRAADRVGDPQCAGGFLEFDRPNQPWAG